MLPLIKMVRSLLPVITGALPLIIAHSNISADIPAAIDAETLVPVMVPGPIGYIPEILTPGAVKSGVIFALTDGPQELFIYKLLSR